jgi:uncharacterized protein YaeQ
MSDTDDAAKLLHKCLAWAREHEDEAELRLVPVQAFADMALKAGRGLMLTDRQIAWIQSVHEKLDLGIHYTNDFSAGRVPLGKSLATPVPEVLLRPLPKRPPGRI